MKSFDSLVKDLNDHLDSGFQSWLFGAGVSCNANIPLMYPLTKHVGASIEQSSPQKQQEIYTTIKTELPEEAHIEDYLSHLVDLIAIANRSRKKSANVSGNDFSLDDLKKLHGAVIGKIGQTVRFGYKSNSSGEPQVGTQDSPLVEIHEHLAFFRALQRRFSNLATTRQIAFITTNYDTLIEDAIALTKRHVVDGLSNGAVAYWHPTDDYLNAQPSDGHVLYKLHGSVDWVSDDEYGLVRARYGSTYLNDMTELMIYPQATKYVETQRDPFASIFTGFRRLLRRSRNSLIVCGYSFSDQHINDEIHAAMSTPGNNSVLIAFVKQADGDQSTINSFLDSCLKDSTISKRVYVATEVGLYHGDMEPATPSLGGDLDWWTFAGLTNFISTGGIHE